MNFKGSNGSVTDFVITYISFLASLFWLLDELNVISLLNTSWHD